MAISKKVIKCLDNNKYKYEIIEHRTTYTAWDTAQTEHVKPQEVVKTLVLKVDKNYAIAVILSNRNLDKKKLIKFINAEKKKNNEKIIKKVEFAKEIWMKKNILGKVGATPPFSEILKINIYADKELLKSNKIYLGSGEYNASIRLGSKEYFKKENPIVGSFSMKK